jgi:lysophospholipase L1-like esterase
MNQRIFLRPILFLMGSILGTEFHAIHAQQILTIKESVKPIRIICLGDSITKGVRPGVTSEQTFEAILQARFQDEKKQVEILNAGIGSERTDQALNRLESDVISKKPEIVTIMYGANDSYIDIGKTEPRLSEMQFRNNLIEIVDRLQKARIQVILMTEPRWGAEAQSNGVGDHPNKRMEPFMEIVREVARAKSTSLVDHYQIWTKKAANGLDIGTITTDQLHPNPLGHKLMAESIEPVLRNLLK